MDANASPAAPVAAGPTGTVAGGPTVAPRFEAVDLLRGVVIVLMALDHVRDFFSDRLYLDATDLTTTTPANFLTRWVTHFCAPTFIFLAGVGAFLSKTRGKSKAQLAWFLLTRGLWLAFLELTVIRASWWFNWDPIHHGAGVFWAIGWSMVVLAGLVFLPISVIATFGVFMIAYHNLLDGWTAERVGLPEWLWVILHQPGDARVVREIAFGTGYCLVPWVGVMAAGFALGNLLLLDWRTRRRELFGLGAALTATFVILRWANVYGDPRPWSEQSDPVFTVLSFLNCTKYPPSLLFLLMTLGPAILALAIFDRPLGTLARPIITFGRVPLFFYLLHVPLIHGGAMLLDLCRFGWSPLAGGGPWDVRPGEIASDYGVSLPTVYLLWLVVLLVLYPPCRWFAEVKRRKRAAWLSYF
jgi:uncharacterized membrane protein